ncbi:MAG TPA: dTMP kinase [Methanothrix sp.]|nr:dTMP kinase [Methanothrix sp.]HRW82897.1 dTMP kinase [Methanothrix sp.]
MRGILITFEGIDGSGKSTIVSEVARTIAEDGKPPFAGRRFLFTAEPTDGEEGRLLRERLKMDSAAEGLGPRSMEAEKMEELFLFMADHARHLAETVIPALEEGVVVISDRYSDSRVAYQGATLREVVPHPLELVREIHRPWSVHPDKTILFSIDPAVAVERCLLRHGEEAISMTAKAPEKFEREEFLRMVSENFEMMTKLEPERFVIIDAAREKKEVLAETMVSLAEILEDV